MLDGLKPPSLSLASRVVVVGHSHFAPAPPSTKAVRFQLANTQVSTLNPDLPLSQVDGTSRDASSIQVDPNVFP